MDNFDLKKYLAEGKLLKENIDFPEMEDEFEGAMDAMVVEPEVYLKDILNVSADDLVSDDYYEVMNAVEQGVYSKDEAVKLAKSWAKEKISGLAEGRLFDEITPLQQYVLDYEKDISGEVSSNVFQSIKSLESAEDVYDYYANERGWEDDEELKDDLKSIFKQVKNKFGGSELTDLQQRALSYVKKRFGNDEAKKDLDIIKSFKERQDFLDYVYKKVEDENNQSEGKLYENDVDIEV